MKKFLLTVAVSLLASLTFADDVQKLDLRPLQDESRILLNPDKGWYHHYYDNTLKKYLLNNDSDLDNYPNMQFLQLRFAWEFLEPEEGKFNWELIDEQIRKWKPKGIRVLIAISAQETGNVYATPKWVVDLGAKGSMQPLLWDKKKFVWEPDYNDPIFLQKLENLQKAIAKRYDGSPDVVSIFIGSMGNWGEGHHLCTSRTAIPVDVIKKHIDIYVKYFKKTLLTINDDLLKYLRTPEEIADLREYVESRKIGYRDDSILVRTSYARNPEKKSFLSEEFFNASYQYAPVFLEMEHYSLITKSGHWKGKNGAQRGADDVREIVMKSHCTYLGYHGLADKFFKENPDFVREMSNKLGYWFFIDEITFNPQSSTLEIVWNNKGAARAFEKYRVELKLKQIGGDEEKTIRLKDADPRQFYSGITRQSYLLELSELPKGKFELFVKMSQKGKSKRVIELGFKENLRTSDGFYRLGELEIR